MSEKAIYEMRFDDMVTNAIRRPQTHHPNVIDDTNDKQYSFRMDKGLFRVYEEKETPAEVEALIFSKTGSYTGDGATSMKVEGVGFKPRYIKIWIKATVDGTAIAIFEATEQIIDDHGGGMSAVHNGGGNEHTLQANTITSLNTDGFTVDDNGADQHPNKSGQVYNYLALK